MKAPTFQTLDALETSPDSLTWANVCRAEGDTGMCDQIMTWYIILDSMEDVSLGKKSQLIVGQMKQMPFDTFKIKKLQL